MKKILISIGVLLVFYSLGHANDDGNKVCRFIPLDEYEQQYYYDLLIGEPKNHALPNQSTVILDKPTVTSGNGEQSLTLFRDESHVWIRYNDEIVFTKPYDISGNYPLGKLFISHSGNSYFTWVEAYGKIYHILNGDIVDLDNDAYIIDFGFIHDSDEYYYIKVEGGLETLVTSRGEDNTHSEIIYVGYSMNQEEFSYVAFDTESGYSLIKDGEYIGTNFENIPQFTYIPNTTNIAYLRYGKSDDVNKITGPIGITAQTGELLYDEHVIPDVYTYAFSDDGSKLAYAQVIGDDYYITIDGETTLGNERIFGLEYFKEGDIFIYSTYIGSDSYLFFGSTRHKANDTWKYNGTINNNLFFYNYHLDELTHMYSCDPNIVYPGIYSVSKNKNGEQLNGVIEQAITDFGEEQAKEIFYKIQLLPQDIRLGSKYIHVLDYVESRIWMEYLR